MRTNVKKSKIFAACLCLLFALTTLIGIAVLPIRNTYAVEGDTVNPLKFKQVAAGRDFAVALTYDNDLYGWSLLKKGSCEETDTNNANGTNITGYNAGGKTLGEYYPSTPVKIKVNLTGVQMNSAGTSITGVGVAVSDAEHYYGNKSGDPDGIAQIAATSTSAAFLTKKGLVYTWGTENTEPSNAGTVPTNVLFRHAPGNDQTYTQGSKFVPNIINYNDANTILPTGGKATAVTEIAASEDNYIVQYTQGSAKSNYIWGQSVYNQLNDTAYAFNKTVSGAPTAHNGASQSYLGDGTVYKFVGGQLQAHGKNFAISSANISGGVTGGVFSKEEGYNLTGGIGKTDNTYIEIAQGVITGWKGVTGVGVSSVADFNGYTEFTLKDAANSEANTLPTIQRSKISAGAGYGYVIASSEKSPGKLAYWGNTAQNLPTGSNYVQVVAGKIRTGKPVLEQIGNSNSVGANNINDDKWETADTTLNSDYVDGKTHVNAVLSNAGTVTVFGSIGDTPIPANTTIDFSAYGVTSESGSTHKIAALFGGYEENLFAISEYGKMFRIVGSAANGSVSFTVTAYDTFTTENESASHTPIDNWDVSEAPEIVFTTGYYDKENNASLSTATVGMNGLSFATEGESVHAGIRRSSDGGIDTNATEAAANRKVISMNNAGDAYRMIVPVNTKSVQTFNGTDESKVTEDIHLIYKEGVSNETEYLDFVRTMQFYWSDDLEHAMPEDVAFRYLGIAYTYSQNDGVRFVITPKRATGDNGRHIVIRYWVGRYDTVANLGEVANNAVTADFYDFKTAEIKVYIQNTTFSRVFSTANGADASVPLLDPNNEHNNTYSIAAMDASEGLKQVAKTLNDMHYAAYYQSGNPTDALHNAVYAGDSGFPRSTRHTKGSLDYYGLKSTDYNNTYLHFADDSDGDPLVFDEIGVTSGTLSKLHGNNEYFSYDARTPATVTLRLAAEGATLSEDEQTALRAQFLGEGNPGDMPTFDNMYGFTFAVTDTGITVSYSVLKITALKSMPASIVSFDGNKIDSPKLVLETANSPTASGINMLVLSITDGKADNADRQEFNNFDGNHHRAVEIFTQSSLTLQSRVAGSPVETPVYGAPVPANGKTNVYTYPNRISIEFDENNAYTVRVADFFKDTSNIVIGFDGEVGADAHAALQATFGSGANALEIDKETMTDKQFTVLARRSVSNFRFSVEVRRLQPADAGLGNLLETADGKAAETITLHFAIDASYTPVTMLATPKTMPIVHESNPNNENVMRIQDRMNIGDAAIKNSKVDVWSSTPSVATAAYDKDTAAITVSPVTSGTSVIYYRVSLNGESEYTYTDSFNVTVATRVSMQQVVRVAEEEQMSVSDLKNEVRRANNLGSNVELSLSNGENGKPFYFQTTEGTSPNDALNVWQDIDSIPFLRDVYVDPDEQAYIAMRMGSFDSAATPPTVRIVVVLSDGKNRYEVAFRVSPAAQTLRDTESGSPFAIEIDKGAGTVVILNRGDGAAAAQGAQITPTEGGSFVVPIKYLTEELMYGYVSGRNYVALAVKAQSADGLTDYGKYVEVALNRSDEASAILITPLYPTAEIGADFCNVQVSVYESTTQSPTILNFSVRISGIKTVLAKSEYQTLFIATFFSVLGLLLIVFFIRMGIYWRKKADQRRIIKKNQTLIKMRDKMHNKTEGVSKEKLVRTKLKMEDPKYAKMFNDMRQEKEAQTGIALDNSLVAAKAERKAKADKASKKKKGKKSLEELQAELAAKREAVARMQMGDFGGAQEGMAPADGVPVNDVPPQAGPAEENIPVFDENAGFEGMSAEQLDEQFRAAMGEDIVFEAVSPDDENGKGE